MYLLVLIRDTWPYLLIALPSLWVLTNALLPRVPNGQRDDDKTRARRAERAREYQRKYTYSDQYGNN